MINELTSRFGFSKLCCLSLDKEKKINRKFVKPKEIIHAMYAFVIDGELVYIGKTKCLWKRFDTYRNAKYWKGAFVSNAIKTDLLENAIKKGTVELYVRECPNMEVNSKILTTLHIEEPRVINHFKPKWNKHYAKYKRN